MMETGYGGGAAEASAGCRPGRARRRRCDRINETVRRLRHTGAVAARLPLVCDANGRCGTCGLGFATVYDLAHHTKLHVESDL
jgi:hypothetical protein